MGRRARANGDEQNVYSRYWRPLYISLGRPGVIAKTKRRTHKRERRDATAVIQRERNDDA